MADAAAMAHETSSAAMKQHLQANRWQIVPPFKQPQIKLSGTRMPLSRKCSLLLWKAFAVMSFGAINVRCKTYSFPREMVSLVQGSQDCHSIPKHTIDALRFSTHSQIKHSETENHKQGYDLELVISLPENKPIEDYSFDAIFQETDRKEKRVSIFFLAKRFIALFAFERRNLSWLKGNTFVLGYFKTAFVEQNRWPELCLLLSKDNFAYWKE